MAAGEAMVAFGALFLVGLLIVGLLILGAALAARPETRTAGLWIMGVIFAIAVALPLVWLFASFSSPQTTWIQNSNGQMIPVSQPPNEVASPVFALFGIFLLFAVAAGMIIMLVNQRTRKAGLVIVGAGLVFLIGYMMIGSSSLHVKSPAPAVAVQEGWSSESVIVDERHEIPVDQPMQATPRQRENVTLPAPHDSVPTDSLTGAPQPTKEVTQAATEPPRASVPPAPPVDTPPSAPPPASAPTSPPANPIAAAPAEVSPPVATRPTPSPAKGTAPNLRMIPPELTASRYPIQTGDRDSLPDWARQGGGIAPDGTFFTVVKCGPHLNFDNCWNDLRNQVDQAVRDYRTRHALGDGYRPPNRSLPDHVRNQLMTDKFLELGDSSVGSVMTLYTRVAFTQEATASVRAWQADLLASNRTIFTTIFGGLVVGLIAVAYGYFRIDTATLGYYSWRLRFIALFFVVGIAISGIAAGAVFFEEESRLGGMNF